MFVHGRNIGSLSEIVRRHGARTLDVFGKVSVVAAVATPAQIVRLADAPSVTYIEANRRIEFGLDTAGVATRANEARAGFVAEKDAAALRANGVDGSGVSVAILDTGLDGRHPMFMQGGRSKVVRNLKLVCAIDSSLTCSGDLVASDPIWIDMTKTTNDSDTATAGGHGTHVAGIAGGVDVTTASGARLRGVAPGAKLVGLGIGAANNIYGAASGLNWVLEHHAAPCGSPVTLEGCPPIKVVNDSLSIGPPRKRLRSEKRCRP